MNEDEYGYWRESTMSNGEGCLAYLTYLGGVAASIIAIQFLFTGCVVNFCIL